MAIAQSLLPEFDLEMANTRKLLAVVPGAKHEYKPHPKSFPLGSLALHIAQLPQWCVMTMTQNELDVGGPFPPRIWESTDKLLATFDENVRAARAALDAPDAAYLQSWTLKAGAHKIFTMPRVDVIRGMVMNHIIHHRGQMTVYLRELDVKLPSLYGPTADG
jgi:uncharacterized damage-inducible protein DinB